MAESIIALAFVTLLVGVFFAGKLFGSMTQRLAEQERQLASLQQQLADNNYPRHTYATAAGLEDATAVAIDLVIQHQAMSQRAEQLRDILGMVRQSPHAYNSDRPAGDRPQGFRP